MSSLSDQAGWILAHLVPTGTKGNKSALDSVRLVFQTCSTSSHCCSAFVCWSSSIWLAQWVRARPPASPFCFSHPTEGCCGGLKAVSCLLDLLFGGDASLLAHTKLVKRVNSFSQFIMLPLANLGQRTPSGGPTNS